MFLLLFELLGQSWDQRAVVEWKKNDEVVQQTSKWANNEVKKDILYIYITSERFTFKKRKKKIYWPIWPSIDKKKYPSSQSHGVEVRQLETGRGSSGGAGGGDPNYNNIRGNWKSMNFLWFNYSWFTTSIFHIYRAKQHCQSRRKNKSNNLIIIFSLFFLRCSSGADFSHATWIFFFKSHASPRISKRNIFSFHRMRDYGPLYSFTYMSSFLYALVFIAQIPVKKICPRLSVDTDLIS